MCCVALSCVKGLHHVSCGLWGCVNLCKHAQRVSQKQVWHVPPSLTHPFSLPVDYCESVVNPSFTSLSINSSVGLLYVVVLSLPPLDNYGYSFLLYSSPYPLYFHQIFFIFRTIGKNYVTAKRFNNLISNSTKKIVFAVFVALQR